MAEQPERLLRARHRAPRHHGAEVPREPGARPLDLDPLDDVAADPGVDGLRRPDVGAVVEEEAGELRGLVAGLHGVGQEGAAGGVGAVDLDLGVGGQGEEEGGDLGGGGVDPALQEVSEVVEGGLALGVGGPGARPLVGDDELRQVDEVGRGDL